MEYGFGVDIGGTTVKLAFFDQAGTLLHKWEIKTNTSLTVVPPISTPNPYSISAASSFFNTISSFLSFVSSCFIFCSL